MEPCWSAVSKLESQVARNPDLPLAYKDIIVKAFEVLQDAGKVLANPKPGQTGEGAVDFRPLANALLDELCPVQFHLQKYAAIRECREHLIDSLVEFIRKHFPPPEDNGKAVDMDAGHYARCLLNDLVGQITLEDKLEYATGYIEGIIHEATVKASSEEAG
jgi:hypothetical protein